MAQENICARCKESFEGDPVVKWGRSYCSEACAFEATERPKPKQCGVPVGDRAAADDSESTQGT